MNLNTFLIEAFSWERRIKFFFGWEVILILWNALKAVNFG